LTGEQSRGFGFITYLHNSDALKVLNKTLKICGKEVLAAEQIECKDALSKNDSNSRVNDEKVKKIFIGGLPPDATEGARRLTR
jgi:RNA recognition motif-containing protein